MEHPPLPPPTPKKRTRHKTARWWNVLRACSGLFVSRQYFRNIISRSKGGGESDSEGWSEGWKWQPVCLSPARGTREPSSTSPTASIDPFASYGGTQRWRGEKQRKRGSERRRSQDFWHACGGPRAACATLLQRHFNERDECQRERKREREREKGRIIKLFYLLTQVPMGPSGGRWQHSFGVSFDSLYSTDSDFANCLHNVTNIMIHADTEVKC